MKTETIDLSPALNIARDSALQWATYRAQSTNTPQCVYVAGPDAPEQAIKSDRPFNVWYVRPEGEPMPKQSQLFQIIYPQPRN